jgi:hypothetical protein
MSIPLGYINPLTMYLFHNQYLPQEPQLQTIYNKIESSNMLNKVSF